MLWKEEHGGGTVAAEKLKCRLYWNAPKPESDLAGQVSLVDGPVAASRAPLRREGEARSCFIDRLSRAAITQDLAAPKS
jgi:hypothetical protein